MGADRRDLSYDGRGNTRYYLAAIDARLGTGHVTVRPAGCDEYAEISQSMDESASRDSRAPTSPANSVARVFRKHGGASHLGISQGPALRSVAPGFERSFDHCAASSVGDYEYRRA